MGNYNFYVPKPPPKGLAIIKHSKYTKDQEFPKNAFGNGVQVEVIGSTKLLCSRSEAPEVTVSIIKFKNDGRMEVYPSNNIQS
jgi:hypothetical protein